MARTNQYLGISHKLEQLLCQHQPGTPLPSEQALSLRFKVSKPTLRRALKELENRGLIQTENGVGSFLLNQPKTLSREIIFWCDDLVFFAETLKVFSIESANRGYISSIVPLSGDAIMRGRIFQTALQRNPAGLILYGNIGNGIDLSVPKRLPMLQLIRRHPNLPGDLLAFQNGAAVTQIVRRFYSEGCRKFVLYGPDEINQAAAEERRIGFLEGMRMIRLRVRENSLLLPGSATEQKEAFFQRFADSQNRPDAVCCLNDHCAGRFFMEMNRRGLHVESLHVSGFDANHFTKFFPKTILTVRPPMAELGKRAVELLIRRIENPRLAESDEILKSELAYTKKEE